VIFLETSQFVVIALLKVLLNLMGDIGFYPSYLNKGLKLLACN
jgi:hypothetical protein